MSKTKKIMLSIIVLTYNHEKYIEKSINSILMQKVNFDYEVLIGNDCSTDNTINILKKYKKCSNFKIYNHKDNKGATKNFYDLLLEASGKYVAFLEGDDYWIDDKKLQKQVDFLENNHEYVGVAHNQEIVNESGNYITTFDDWSRTNSKVYRFKDVEKGRIFFQMNSLIVRNFFNKFDFTFFYKLDSLVADRSLYAFYTSLGDIAILRDVMSAYRWFEKKDRKESVYDSSIKSLKYYEKFQNVNLPNNKKLNFSKYMNHIVASYYILSIIKKEKLSKENNNNIKRYATAPIIYVIILWILEYFITNIRNILKRKIK